MEITIELEVNLNIKKLLNLPRNFGNFELLVDTPLEFKYFKNKYLDIIFTHDDASLDFLTFDEEKLSFRFFNRQNMKFINDDFILENDNIKFIKVFVNLKEDNISYKNLLPLINKNNDILCIMVGGNLIDDKKLKENFTFPRIEKKINSKYEYSHDMFRQQLPIPIIMKMIEKGSSLNLILIDPGFQIPEIFKKIDSLKNLDFKKKDVITQYEALPLHNLLNDIFDLDLNDSLFSEIKVKITTIEKLIDNSTTYEIIPHIQDRLYYIYLGTFTIKREAIISNDSIESIDNIIVWHNDV